MDCKSCESLQWEIDYLESRNQTLLKEHDDLEAEFESLKEDRDGLERRIDQLESERADLDDIESELKFKVSLYNLEMSRSSLTDGHKLALTKELLGNVIAMLGADVCLQLV